MAVCHAALGHADEARDAVGRYRAAESRACVATFMAGEPYRDPATVARLREALLAAGLPERAQSGVRPD
jgi:hypothetical protein